MGSLRANGSSPSPPPPPPPPAPESPPEYGKRRELARIQALEREIGFLQEEVKSVGGIQPASRSCKEIADFVTCNADPLIPAAKKNRRSHHIWEWLRCRRLEKLCCCDFSMCSCKNGCASCCWNSQCFNKLTCCCVLISGKCCRCYCKCPKGGLCSCCNKSCCCCYNCCFSC